MCFLRTLLLAFSVQAVSALVPIDHIPTNDSAAALQIQAVPVRQTTYPTVLNHRESSQHVIDGISTYRMEETMKALTAFHTRHYQTATGVEASDWVFDQVKRYHGTFKIQEWRHDWPQRSIDVQISQGQGRKVRHVVVGAHLDSINIEQGMDAANTTKAPGADDNASGVAVLMEALYLLLRDRRTSHFRNQVHFHFYSAEEVGLKGSADIFEQYRRGDKDVVAFLNQDMAGLTPVKRSKDRFTMVVDHTYGPLNTFLGKVIRRYTNLGFKKYKCGYGCSDHAAATRNGFPSAFISHSRLNGDVSHIHTSQDTLDSIDYDHMAEHVKLVLGFVYELGWAEIADPDQGRDATMQAEEAEQPDDFEPESESESESDGN